VSGVFRVATSLSFLASLVLIGLVASQVRIASQSLTRAQDPGVRAGAAGAGGAVPGLTAGQLEYFEAGHTDFAQEESVAEGLARA